MSCSRPTWNFSLLHIHRHQQYHHFVAVDCIPTASLHPAKGISSIRDKSSMCARLFSSFPFSSLVAKMDLRMYLSLFHSVSSNDSRRIPPFFPSTTPHRVGAQQSPPGGCWAQTLSSCLSRPEPMISPLAPARLSVEPRQVGTQQSPLSGRWAQIQGSCPAPLTAPLAHVTSRQLTAGSWSLVSRP